MALSKSFADGQILTPADVNQHLVNHVPKAGDVYDTGWVNVAPAEGYTFNQQPQVRRVGQVVYWRGDVQGAFTPSYTTVAAASALPAWAIPPRSYRDSVSALAGDGALIAAVGVVDLAGLRISVSSGSTTAINLKGLSGYTVN